MAQFPEVPQYIKEELQIKQLNLNSRTLSYGIAYPRDYDANKKHKALICLTGGGFSQQLAYYFYHVYTPRKTFKNYIKIYLISSDYKSILAYHAHDWRKVMTALQVEENLTENEWVISGASNGGLATYTLISALPSRFEGYITIPGSMGRHELRPEWKNYKVLIVYMDRDYGWIESSKRDFEKLRHHVKDIELLEIKGYGHILPETYDIEPIYQKYLEL